jgi:hypothetical protein
LRATQGGKGIGELNSSLIVHTCLFEAIIHAPYGALVFWLERSALVRIVDTITPIRIEPWRWGEGRFYANTIIFMLTT